VRQRQEYQEFKISLGYVERHLSKNKKRNEFHIKRFVIGSPIKYWKRTDQNERCVWVKYIGKEMSEE
jgi:phage terminase large subunit GpA-like protein